MWLGFLELFVAVLVDVRDVLEFLGSLSDFYVLLAGFLLLSVLLWLIIFALMSS